MCCTEHVARIAGAVLWLVLAGSLSACQDIGADLAPSATDHRPAAESGVIGHLPGQTAPGFALTDSLGNMVRLADQLTGNEPADVVVLYFTMWCPVCLSHSDHMSYAVVPQFAGRGTVRYYLVDYVSGSVTAARASELANGYGGGSFVTLVDSNQAVYDAYHAAMGTVVVIDGSGTVRLNEDYRDGSALADMLDALLPAN